MVWIAQNTHKMMTVIDPAAFRFPQPKDHFLVKLTTDARRYLVVNDGYQRLNGYSRATMNYVTFKVAESGARLASCTCQDYANIKVHGRQCKHIRVAYHFHISRMKAQHAATQQGA